MNDHNCECSACEERFDEIERLRGQLDRVARVDDSIANQLQRSIETNSKLRERLAEAREALTHIANIFDDTYICGSLERGVGDFARSILTDEQDT